jgi:hypothetical protein
MQKYVDPPQSKKLSTPLSRPNCKWIQRVGFLGMISRMHLPIKSYVTPVSGGIDPCHVRPGFLTVDHG